MQPKKQKLNLESACKEIGINKEILIHFIEEQWIFPEYRAERIDIVELDDEDLARARLILELKDDFGVNEAGIPIILHLLDQIYALRSRVKEAA